MVYGAAGTGFAGANLILARVLPPVEYAIFTLVTALVNLAISIAPLGLDGIVIRHRLVAGPGLLARVIGAGTLVALALAAVAATAYDVTRPLLAILMASTIAGGAMIVAGAWFQNQQRFGMSLGLIQSPNLVLLLAALVVAAARGSEAWLPLLIVSAGFTAAAACGWVRIFREQESERRHSGRLPWGEGLAFLGLAASGLILVQMDRLMIPHVLQLQDLATYGVLAAIAGSLFRVLQMGVGYSLLPRLRAAPSVRARRRLITQEARLVGGIVLVGSAVIWFVTPLIERWFLAGKYHLTGSLVLAAICAGVAKILNSFGKATVTALADVRELTLVNLMGWVAVAIAVPASMFGARWGLAGVIYGVGLAWTIRAAAAFYITLHHVRLPASAPVTAP